MRFLLTFAAATAATLVGTMTATMPVAAATQPAFDAEPCCALCPQAGDPANYEGSSYRAGFRMLIQGTDNWLFRSEFDLATRFGLSDNDYSELHRFSNALKMRGTKLVLVYVPPRGLMDSDRLKPEQRASYDFDLARRNFGLTLQRFQDLGGVIAPRLDMLAQEGKGYDYFFRRDHHWTPSGAQHSAEVVARAIQSLPEYASMARRKFVTKRTGTLQKPGSIQRFATQVCGFGYPMQFADAYTTEPQGDADLLGDARDPQVVLVGTSLSNSNVNFNFVGYLEQYLSTDVLNAAVSGGGYDTSLLQYLHSEDFQKEPPEVIVWETPYYDFSGDSKKYLRFFREAIPAVTDGCKTKTPLLTSTVSLHAGSNEVLFNGGGRILPLVSRHNILELKLSDPEVKEIWLKVYYLNGVKERLHLRYGQYYKSDGRFITELRHDTSLYADATFMAMNVELPAAPAQPLSVTATLCEGDGDAPPLPFPPGSTTVAASTRK